MGKTNSTVAQAFLPVFLLVFSSALSARLKTGLDILVDQDFAPIAGKRVGVIANDNSRTWDHRSIITLLAASTKVKLAAIFAPEHGLAVNAQAGASIPSAKDGATGAPVFSLHEHGVNRPTPAMLKNLDALVYDLQEVGARFWTYTTTLGLMLEAAAAQKIPIYVLDRPNPINGVAVEGALLDPAHFSIIGYGRRPIRHGMTSGELAQLFNGENKIGADLHVIKMKVGGGACGWTRRGSSGSPLHRTSEILPKLFCTPAHACSKTQPYRSGEARIRRLKSSVRRGSRVWK